MNPTSRRKKTPCAGTPGALDNIKNREEINVMSNISIAIVHRTKAIAALRADAPISVRLARYNAAMAKVRSREAQELAQ